MWSRNILIILILSLSAWFVESNFVINTWSGVFEDATKSAYDNLTSGGSSLDAIEHGCNTCENEQCDTSVGFGNHPDSSGQTSLDAMIMDGNTFDIGSVAYIRRFRNVISIARAVMTYTSHSMLVGAGAEDFATMLGFSPRSASTENSFEVYKQWQTKNCQPNFYENIEEAKSQCGPYPPQLNMSSNTEYIGVMVKTNSIKNNWVNSKDNHDTIGMVVIDDSGSMACGTSTNGANHKVAGRVGDSPIPGAGCYVNSRVGGAAATGDGDIMLRFLPSFYAVMLMEQGLSPATACQQSIARIVNTGASFSGGVVCVNKDGVHAGAANNMSFSYSFMKDGDVAVQVVTVA